MFSQFVALCYLFVISEAIEISLYNEDEKKFIQLINVSTLSNVENLSLPDDKNDVPNFNKAIVKLMHYDDGNIVRFVENNTRITGCVGELWNNLADFLNFTLVPIKIRYDTYGELLPNGSYTGLVGLVQRNETQILPRSVPFPEYLPELAYSFPLWRTSYGIYTKPIWRQEEFWMLKIFSVDSWVAFVLVLSVLSMMGYIFGKIQPRKKNYDYIRRVDLDDHILYTIALATQQGCVPNDFVERSRKIYIITTLFSFFVVVAFNAVAIFSMMEKRMNLPFYDLKSLLLKSDYILMTPRGSWMQTALKIETSKYLRYRSGVRRVVFTESTAVLYDAVCSGGSKHVAAFLSNDRYQADAEKLCTLVQAEETYFETWTSSAIKRGFHSHSFNAGFIKMYETGLFKGLRNHWLGNRIKETRDSNFEPVELSQIVLSIYILSGGVILSVALFTLELMSFYSQKLFFGIKKKNSHHRLRKR